MSVLDEGYFRHATCALK